MRRRTSWIAVTIAIAALIAAAWAIYVTYSYTRTAAAGKSLAEQVADTCARGGPTAAELGQACAKAEEVKDQPVAEQTPAPDPALLRQAARTAVADYCAAHNGCRGADGTSPNFDAIVTNVVARIPVPRDGRDGTDAQPPDWGAVVAAYCGQTSDPCRGPAGVRGDTGAAGAQGVQGEPGPTCPPGYELRDAVITAPDGSTYQGKACVDPNSSKPPNDDPDPPLPTPTN